MIRESPPFKRMTVMNTHGTFINITAVFTITFVSEFTSTVIFTGSKRMAIRIDIAIIVTETSIYKLRCNRCSRSSCSCSGTRTFCCSGLPSRCFFSLIINRPNRVTRATSRWPFFKFRHSSLTKIFSIQDISETKFDLLNLYRINLSRNSLQIKDLVLSKFEVFPSIDRIVS